MKQALGLALALCFAFPHVASARECVTEMRDFDYMETSPQEFMQGTPEQVRSGYQAMLDLIGDVASVRHATQFFVDGETYSKVTARECAGELCRGRDLVEGEIECARETGVLCTPLAAIKDGTLYCVLKPAFEHTIGQPPFQPFR